MEELLVEVSEEKRLKVPEINSVDSVKDKLLKRIGYYINVNCYSYISVEVSEKGKYLKDYCNILFSRIFKKHFTNNEIYKSFKVLIEDTPTKKHICGFNFRFQFIGDNNRINEEILVTFEEMFSNCGMVVIHKMTVSRDYKILDDYPKLLSDIFNMLETLAVTFKYSCILYTASRQENRQVIHNYLKDNYTKLSEFINKRGLHGITTYQKLI